MVSVVLSSRSRLQRVHGNINIHESIREIGLTGKERNRTVNDMSDVAEKASRWIWLKRSENRWEPNSYHVPQQETEANIRSYRLQVIPQQETLTYIISYRFHELWCFAFQ